MLQCSHKRKKARGTSEPQTFYFQVESKQKKSQPRGDRFGEKGEPDMQTLFYV